MFGAHYFAEIDFEHSYQSSQLFDREDRAIEVPGSVLKINEGSALVLDIKRMDLSTGEISDYGFAIQPLIHRLKDRNLIIAGRYQMPIYGGSFPTVFLNASPVHKPRTILKRLVEDGKVETLGNMQVVTEVADLYPEPDSAPIILKAIPSMLHHIDRSKLE